MDSRPYEFTELVDLETKRQTIRDTVETDTPVRYVLDMEVLFEEPTVSRNRASYVPRPLRMYEFCMWRRMAAYITRHADCLFR